MRLKRRGVVALGGLAAGYWMRTHPSACPYSLRFVLRFPRRALALERLLEMLAPQPGERVLELGPGIGYYTFDVASALSAVHLPTSRASARLVRPRSALPFWWATTTARQDGASRVAVGKRGAVRWV